MARVCLVASRVYEFKILVIFFIAFSSLEANKFCQQQRFSRIASGNSLTTNVISSHNVDSTMECSQHCLRETACVGFNYRTKSIPKDPNCQLTNSSEHSRENDGKNYIDDWTFYAVAETASPMCLNNPCKNGGICLGTPCLPEGFSCECRSGYTGKLCETEEVFKSCKEVLERFSDAQNGPYNIDTNTAPGYTKVYCQMTSLPGCSGGGWTMVMKIDGKKHTFLFNSSYWENNEAYNLPGGLTAFDDQETQLPTYNSMSFHELCLGMKVNDELNFATINYEATSLYSLFAGRNFHKTHFGRENWKSLISGSSLQFNCNREGFNAEPLKDDTAAARVRLGIVAYGKSNCHIPKSFLGFGSQFSSHINTCGNFAIGKTDNGDRDTKAMGYILVR